MQWYYAIGGQRQGPVTQAEFDQLVQVGTVTPATLVWREGLADWVPWSQVQAAGTATAGASSADTEVCAVSGKRYLRREMIQYGGRWISAEHRDEYFQRLREGVVPSGDFVYAGFWPRFGAKFIDGLILGVVGVGVNVVCALLLLGTANYFNPQAAAQAGAANAITFQIVTILLGQAVSIGFAVFFLQRYDATPGKMALGLKVLRPDGAKLTKGRIIGRHFAELISGFILCIGYLMVAFDGEKRSLHDRICDSRVIKTR